MLDLCMKTALRLYISSNARMHIVTEEEEEEEGEVSSPRGQWLLVIDAQFAAHFLPREEECGL